MSTLALQLAPSMTPVTWGVSASLVAGFATAAGALLIFWVRELGSRLVAVLMGLAAGAMLSASLFSLLLPAARQLPLHQLAAGAGLGVLTLWLADRFAPLERLAGEGARSAWLITLAMALHNFPEGLAVGAGFSAANLSEGLGITTSVLLQDLPEGLITALALAAAHYRRARIFWIVALTGVVEMLGGLLGVFAASRSSAVLPFVLAFSGAAMLYVIFHELLPSALKEKRERPNALTAALAGFFGLLQLGAWLG